MADNRMYLFCPDCNEGLLVAKNLAGEWYLKDDGMAASFVNFMNTHQYCGPTHDSGTGWERGSHVQVRYESAWEQEDELPTGLRCPWRLDTSEPEV